MGSREELKMLSHAGADGLQRGEGDRSTSQGTPDDHSSTVGTLSLAKLRPLGARRYYAHELKDLSNAGT
jgi:hypothetical protein